METPKEEVIKVVKVEIGKAQSGELLAIMYDTYKGKEVKRRLPVSGKKEVLDYLRGLDNGTKLIVYLKMFNKGKGINDAFLGQKQHYDDFEGKYIDDLDKDGKPIRSLVVLNLIGNEKTLARK